MKIKVTEEHIARGNKCCAGSCPIALAIVEAFKVFSPRAYVAVGANSIIVGRDRYKVPLSVIYFIEDFDDGEHVNPFEFELPEPTEKT